MTHPVDYSVQVNTVAQGYDRKTCWVQTRAGVIPPDTAVITTQKLLLSGSDIFYAIHDIRSNDRGKTWTAPVKHDTLARQPVEGGGECCPCDATPTWHAATNTLLITGHTATYAGDHLAPYPRQRSTFYSTYDPARHDWAAWRCVDMPDPEKFFSSGAGCGQRVDLPNGDILLPIYFCGRENPKHCYSATVMRCAFDGQTLSYLEHGTELTIETPRGLYEPSLAHHGGRFFLTLRSDQRGYVASGPDGLTFGPPRPWTFDDGSELGNYNTQQHWVTHSDALFLVYTRRGANNDHVFRHRAPLFMAQVDPDRLCVIRATERIVVPERGARLGNFGTVQVSPEESWVVVSEWMQTTGPNSSDSTVCERYGSNNSLLVSRIRWASPNRLAMARPGKG